MNNYYQPTFLGTKFDLLEPTKKMIDIKNIAHHLSIENRWNGATRFPISVAYHSIMVCNNMPKGLELEGLLHDSHESEYKDLPFFLKRLILAHTDIYNQLCYNFDLLIEDKYEVELIKNHHIISEVDQRVAKTELQLFNKIPKDLKNRFKDVQPYSISIQDLPYWNVEQEFLKLFKKYRRKTQ